MHRAICDQGNRLLNATTVFQWLDGPAFETAGD
jgi:hypothetical protein